MKKLLLMASAIALSISCSSSDNDSDNKTNNNSAKITPPAWIQGTWEYETSPTGYRFSNNNICQIVISGETCMKEYIELYANTQVQTNVEQKITDNEYYCKVSVSASSNIFHFQKISSNTIKDVTMSKTVGSDVLLKKQ